MEFAPYEMAFIIPVVRKDFQLYGNITGMEERKERKETMGKKSNQQQIVVRELGGQGSSRDPDVERQKRLSEIKQRRQQKLYSRKRQNSCVLRKISEINEENEGIEQELVFNERENGFTVLRKLSDVEEDSGHESESRSESSDSSEIQNSESAEKKKKNRILNMIRWVSKSKKSREPKPQV